MGTWLHGWVELRYGKDSPWVPFMTPDELLGLKAWWRIPVFGHSKWIDYFDPVPFVDGVPDDLSDLVALAVLGRKIDEDSYEIQPVDERFYDPRRDAQYVTFDELGTVDWDEPRHAVGPQLRELDDADEINAWSFEEELLRAFRFELRDASGTVLEERARDASREAQLAAVAGTVKSGADLVDRCDTDLPERLALGDGPVRLGDGELHAVRPARRHYLQDEWFILLKLVDRVLDVSTFSAEDVRWFCYFSH